MGKSSFPGLVRFKTEYLFGYNFFPKRYLPQLFTLCDIFEYTIYPTPPPGQDMTQGHFLSGV